MEFNNGNFIPSGKIVDVDASLLGVARNKVLAPEYNYINPNIKPLNQYDIYLHPGMDQEHNRGTFQSAGDKWWKGIRRSALSIVPKVGQGIGALMGLGQAAVEGDISKVWDNPMMEAMDKVEEALKEQFPIYLTNQYSDGNLASKIFTAEFWAADGLDGLAFLASAYVGGSGFAKVAQGTGKVLSKTKMYEALSKLGKGSESLKSLGISGDVAATALYNNISESGVEARGIYNELVKQGVDKGKASQAAKETFLWNLAVLAPSNVIQAKWFNKAPKNRFKDIVEKINNKEIPKISPKVLAKEFGKGVLSEGLWEENIQNAITSYEKDFATGVTESDTFNGVLSNYATGVKGFAQFVSPFHTTEAHTKEDEAATAVLLGGIIGGPANTISNIKKIRASQGQYNEISKWLDSTNPEMEGMAKNVLIPAMKNPFQEFSTEVAVMDEETGKPKLDENKNPIMETHISLMNEDGEYVRDPRKINNGAVRVAVTGNLYKHNLYSTFTQDAVHDRYNNHMSAAQVAYRLATADYINDENLDTALDMMKTPLEEGTKDLLKSQGDNSDMLKLVKDYYKSITETAAKIKGVDILTGEKTTEEFKDLMVRYLSYQQIKVKALESLKEVTESEAAIESLDKEIESLTQSINDTFANKKSIISDYKDMMERFNDTLENKDASPEDVYLAEELYHTQLKQFNQTDKISYKAAPKLLQKGNLTHQYIAQTKLPSLLHEQVKQLVNDDRVTSKELIDYSSLNSKDLTKESKKLIARKVDKIESARIKNDEIKDLENSLYSGQLTPEEAQEAERKFNFLGEEKKSAEATIHSANNLVSSHNPRRTLPIKPELGYLWEYFLKGATSTAKLYEKNKTTFSRATNTVNKEIEKVEIALKAYKKKTNSELSDKEIEKTIQELKDLLVTLKEAKELARENQAKKHLKNKVVEEETTKLWDTILGNVPELNYPLVDTLKVTDTEGEEYQYPLAKWFTKLHLLKENKEDTKNAWKQLRDKKLDFVNLISGQLDINKDVLYHKTFDTFLSQVVSKISNITELPAGVDPKSPVYRFYKSKDFTELLEDIYSLDYPDKENIVEVVEAFVKIHQINNLMNLLVTPHNLLGDKGLITTMVKNINPDLTPSIEQFISTLQSVASLTKNVKGGKQTEEDFLQTSVTYLQGPAGSGKTEVVASLALRTFLELNNVSEDKVAAVSNNDRVTAKLKKSLGINQGLSKIELMSGSVDLSKVKIIVMDEAAAMTTLELSAIFTQVAKYNSTAEFKDRVNVFALGDPSQAHLNELPKILQAGNIVSPLTISYRTNIGIITEVYNLYKNNGEPVTDITGEANVDLQEAMTTPKNLVGVLGGTNGESVSSTIKNILNSRPSGDGRSRAVLIADKSQEKNYSGLDVEVTLYNDFQGLQADEVYIDIPVTGRDFKSEVPFLNRKSVFTGDSMEDYNTAMYTALSRAKFFVYSGANEITSIKDVGVEKQSVVDTEVFEKNEELFDSMYSTIQQYSKEFLNKEVPKVKKKTPKAEEETSFTEEGKDTPQDGTDKATGTVEDTEASSEEDLGEDKERITEIDSKGKIKEIKKVSEVASEKDVIVEQSIFYPNTDLMGKEYVNKEALIVMYEDEEEVHRLALVTQSEKDPELHEVLAILGEKDLKGTLGNILGDYSKADNNVSVTKIKSRKPFRIVGEPLLTTHVSLSQKIKPIYDSRNPSYTRRALESAVSLFSKTFFQKTTLEQKATNNAFNNAANLNQVDWKALKNDVKMLIFDKKTLLGKASSNVDLSEAELEEIRILNEQMKIQPGKPYMVFFNPQSTQMKKRAKPFIISLANVGLSKNEWQYKALRSLQDNLDYIKEILGGKELVGNKDFGQLLKIYSSQFKVDSSGKDPEIVFDTELSNEEILNLSSLEGVSKKEDEEKLEQIRPYLTEIVKGYYGVSKEKVRITEKEFNTLVENGVYDEELYKWEEFVVKDGNKDKKGQVVKQTLGDKDRIVSSEIQKQYILKSGKGIFQKAMNDIARENKTIEGFNIRVDFPLTKGGETITIFQAKHLFPLDPRSNQSYRQEVVNKLYKEYFGKPLEGVHKLDDVLADIADKGGLSNEDVVKKYNELVTYNLSDGVLDYLTNFEGSTHSTQTEKGLYYVRQPISIKEFNEKGSNIGENIDRLEQLVGTSLKGMTPTRLDIMFTAEGGQVNKEEEFIPSVKPVLGMQSGNIEEVFKLKIKDVSKELDKEQKSTLKKEMELYKKFKVGKKLTRKQMVEAIALAYSEGSEEKEFFIETHEDFSDEEIKEEYDEIVGHRRAFNATNNTLTPDSLTIMSKEEAIKTYKKLLPGVPFDKSNIEFIQKALLDKMAQKEEDLYGLYTEKGKIYVATNKEGEVYREALLHEIFHKVYQGLSKAERAHLNRLGEKKWGQKVGEEFLAQKLQDWEEGKISVLGTIKNFFNKILSLLGFNQLYHNDITDMFNSILKGVYSPDIVIDGNHRMAMNLIKDRFGSISIYQEAITDIRSLMWKYTQVQPYHDKKSGQVLGGNEGLMVSPGEALKYIKRDLEKDVRRFEQRLDEAENNYYKLSKKALTKEEIKALPVAERKVYVKAKRRVYTAKKDFEVYSKLLFEDTLKKVVNLLYPDFISAKEYEVLNPVDENSVEEELGVKALVDYDGTAVNLSEFIDDNDTKNQEKAVSKTLKLWLMGLRTDAGTYLSDRFAYFQMLHLADEIDLLNLDNIEEEIEAFEKKNPSGEATSLLLQKVIETSNQAKETHYTSVDENGKVKLTKIPRNIQIVSNNNALSRKTTYYIAYTDNRNKKDKIHLDGKDLLEEVIDLKDVNITKIETESLGELYKQIQEHSELTQLHGNKQLFNALYSRSLSRDILRAMANSFGSMKNQDIYLVLHKNNFGVESVRYIKGQSIGLQGSVSSLIERALIDKLTKTNYLKGEYKKTLELLNSVSPKEQKKGIIKFLKDLGLYDIADNLTLYKSSELIENIKGTMVRAVKYGNFEDTYKEEGQSYNPTEHFIKDNQSLFNALSVAATMESQLLKGSTQKDSKGNTVFKRITADFIHKMYKGLEKGLKDNRKMPSIFKTPFYAKFNPFIRGDSKIYERGYHDGIKNDFTKVSVSYGKENNERNWYFREFVGGFLGGLSSLGKSSPVSYWHYSYVLSNRGKVPVVKTDLHSKERTLQLAQTILDQMAERPDILENFFEKYSKDSKVMAGFLKDGIEGYKKEIDKEVDFVTETIWREEVKIPGSINKIYDRLIKEGMLKKKPKGVGEEFKSSLAGEYLVTKDQIKPLVDLWIHNHYVNSYFFNQLFFNDYAFYGDGNAVLKRGSGASSPMIKALINKLFGMKKTFNIGIHKDIEVPLEVTKEELDKMSEEELEVAKKKGSVKQFLQRFIKDEKEVTRLLDYFGRAYEWTDAQGFITPNRNTDLKKGFSNSFGIGNINKPVYYGIEHLNKTFSTKKLGEEWAKEVGSKEYKFEVVEGGHHKVITEFTYPIYIKYSTAVLSPELIENFPDLQKILDYMSESGMDELVFNTTIKAGLPSVVNDIEKMNSKEAVTMTLSNENYGIQLNPVHKADDKVSVFTQLMYFMNVYQYQGGNNVQTKKAYSNHAFLMQRGLEYYRDQVSSPEKIKKMLLRAFNKPGYERVHRLLQSNIPFNSPALESVSVAQVASKGLQAGLKSVKFPGGKYQLQSALGITKAHPNFYTRDENGELLPNAEELNYTTLERGSMKMLVSEGVVPRGVLSPEVEAKIENGEEVYMMSDAMAFRIPSTEIHSAVAIKVVGFYDSKGTNAIIMPKEIVPLHGSDFDADALFMVVRTRAKKDINVKGTLLIKEGQDYGYEKNEESGLLEYNPEKLLDMTGVIRGSEGVSDTELKILRNVEEQIALNGIIDAVQQVIQDPKNLLRMLSPISMERVVSKDKEFAIKYKLRKIGDLRATNEDKDMSSVVGKQIAHKSVFDGANLIGDLANVAKVFAYVIKAGIPKDISSMKDSFESQLQKIKALQSVKNISEEQIDELHEIQSVVSDLKLEIEKYEDNPHEYVYPHLKQDFHIILNGTTYTAFTEQENGSGIPVWETLDALINLAIDNTKEQGLYLIGANSVTTSAIGVGVMLGIPLYDLTLLMRQPIINELTRAKYSRDTVDSIKQLKEQLMELGGKEEGSKSSHKELEKYVTKFQGGIFETSKLSKKDATHFIGILNEFEKIYKVGEHAGLISDFLSILRDGPTSPEAMAKLQDSVGKAFEVIEVEESNADTLEGYLKNPTKGILIARDDFSFDIPELLNQNPQIATAWNLFKEYYGVIQEHFFVHKKETYKFINELNMKQVVKLSQIADSKLLNGILINRELVKFVSSSIYKDKILKSPDYTFIDNSNREITLEGVEAWMQHFIERVNKVQKLDQKDSKRYLGNVPNSFLMSLRIKGSKSTLKSLSFVGGLNRHDGQQELIEEHFNQLRNYSFDEKGNAISSISPIKGYTEFQKDFLVFAILKSGLQFSVMDIAQVLPPQLLKGATIEINNLLENYTQSAQAKNERYSFKFQMVTSTADKLPWADKKKTPLIEREEYPRYVKIGKKKTVKKLKGTYGFDTKNDLYYDISYKNNDKKLPAFLKTGSGNSAVAFIKVKEDSVTSYYQRVGSIKQGTYTPYLENFEYLPELYFNSLIPNISVKDNKLNTLEGGIDLRELVGHTLSLSEYSNIDRTGRRFVTLISSKERKEGKDVVGYTYKVKDATEEEIDAILNRVGFVAPSELDEDFAHFEEIDKEKGIVSKSLKERESEINKKDMYLIKKETEKDQTLLAEDGIVTQVPNKFSTIEGMTIKNAQRFLGNEYSIEQTECK